MGVGEVIGGWSADCGSSRVWLCGICIVLMGCPGEAPPPPSWLFAECGNGVVDSSEECEEEDLNGKSCEGLGLAEGTLRCYRSSCGYDASQCVGVDICGNGTVESQEECDGGNLGGMSCEALGYALGVLDCHNSCRYDESQCIGPDICGNGIADLGEECDGKDLGGADCESLGLALGTLQCSHTCGYDASKCIGPGLCGNGLTDPEEECDSNHLNGETCLSLGSPLGVLQCDESCRYDRSQCLGADQCGNGFVEQGEDCEGLDPNGETCQGLGYSGPSLICVDCQLDASQCVRPPLTAIHVSVALDGASANTNSTSPRVSADGNWVAFISDASNLIADDENGRSDLYLRGMDTTTRISDGVSGEANGDTKSIDMSADGSVIVFQSDATNLTEPSSGMAGEIYYWTESSGIISVTSGGTEEQSYPRVSSDGSHLTWSWSRQLLPARDMDDAADIYTMRLSDGELSLDSLSSTGGNGQVYWSADALAPTISADGRFVGFYSPARGLDTPEITVANLHPYIKDRVTGTLTRTSRHDGGIANCEDDHHGTYSIQVFPSVDGTLGVFHSYCPFDVHAGEPADEGGFRDVFVRDLVAEATMRVSLGWDGSEANGDSTLLDTSDDARFVLFGSDATNIVPDDTNGVADLFVHDRQEGTTIRVSYDAEYGEFANGALPEADLSANGDWVVFSTLDDVRASDTNSASDIYLVQVR